MFKFNTIFKFAALISLTNIITSVINFFIQLYFSRKFGTSQVMDMYFSIISIPNSIAGNLNSIVIFTIVPWINRNMDYKNDLIAILNKIFIALTIVILILSSFFSLLNTNFYLKTYSSYLVNIGNIVSILVWLNLVLAIYNSWQFACILLESKYVKYSICFIIMSLFNLLSVLILTKYLSVASLPLGLVMSRLMIMIYLSRDISSMIVSQKIVKKCLSVINISNFWTIIKIVVSFVPNSFFYTVIIFFSNFHGNGVVSAIGYSYSYAGFISVALGYGLSITGCSNTNCISEKSKIKEYKSIIKSLTIVSVIVVLIVLVFKEKVLRYIVFDSTISDNSIILTSNMMNYFVLSTIFIALSNYSRSYTFLNRMYNEVCVSSLLSFTILVVLCIISIWSNNFILIGYAYLLSWIFIFLFIYLKIVTR